MLWTPITTRQKGPTKVVGPLATFWLLTLPALRRLDDLRGGTLRTGHGTLDSLPPGIPANEKGTVAVLTADERGPVVRHEGGIVSGTCHVGVSGADIGARE